MLGKAGYRVPEDIGSEATNVRDMPVDAGIDQNPEEIGRITPLAVISLIHDSDLGIPEFIPRNISEREMGGREKPSVPISRTTVANPRKGEEAVIDHWARDRERFPLRGARLH